MTTQEQYMERMIVLLERIAAAVETMAEPKRKPRKVETADLKAQEESVRAFVREWNICAQKHGGKLWEASMPSGGSSRWKQIVDCLAYEGGMKRWGAAMEALNKSSFHTGGNERGWKANIDFLIGPGQRIKWLEAGDYMSRSAAQGAQKSPSMVWCVKCDGPATAGPGTRNPGASNEPVCAECLAS